MTSVFIHWNPSPDLLTIPGIHWPLRWYGLCWAAGFLICSYIMGIIFKAENRSAKQLDRLTMYIIFGTVIGARLGHCFFYGPFFDVYDADGFLIEEGYLSHPLNILKVYEGGLASHGGAIGIITAMLLYGRKFKESYLWLFDRMVIVVPVARALIRLGNLMNSEIIGNITTLPWGFIFERIDPAHPRHPSQLYEALYCVILFIVFFILWLKYRQQLKQGFMFGLFCVLLFMQRFLTEFLKENQVSFEDQLPLNMGQILSLPFIGIGLWMMLRKPKSAPSK